MNAMFPLQKMIFNRYSQNHIYPYCLYPLLPNLDIMQYKNTANPIKREAPKMKRTHKLLATSAMFRYLLNPDKTLAHEASVIHLDL